MQKEKNIFETPFIKLNEILCGGFRKGTLSVIGGLTCMGKTSFLLSLLQAWGDEKVAFFSFDTSLEHLSKNIFSIEAEVPLKKILNDDMTGEEVQRIIEARGRISEYDKFFTNDKNDILKKIEEATEIGCKIILIDTLQLMIKTIDIYQEISLIVNRLKEIAINKEVCIIVTSQLNRKVYERTGHRPFINDLRDSGHIEECADHVIFINRREYFDPHDKPGEAEIIIEKNRFGNIGSFTLMFRKEIGQFTNLAKSKFDTYKNIEL